MVPIRFRFVSSCPSLTKFLRSLFYIHKTDTRQTRGGRRTGSPPAPAGPCKDDQGDTQRVWAGSASRHGGGALPLGRVHHTAHDRVPGIPLSYRAGKHVEGPGDVHTKFSTPDAGRTSTDSRETATTVRTQKSAPGEEGRKANAMTASSVSSLAIGGCSQTCLE